ncbi:hypothetical protein KA005_32820 [bacterium]|nr:hypothetical protein [bacterium]
MFSQKLNRLSNWDGRKIAEFLRLGFLIPNTAVEGAAVLFLIYAALLMQMGRSEDKVAARLKLLALEMSGQAGRQAEEE